MIRYGVGFGPAGLAWSLVGLLLVVALVNLITNPLLTYVLLVAGHVAGWGGRTTSGYVALLVAGPRRHGLRKRIDSVRDRLPV